MSNQELEELEREFENLIKGGPVKKQEKKEWSKILEDINKKNEEENKQLEEELERELEEEEKQKYIKKTKKEMKNNIIQSNKKIEENLYIGNIGGKDYKYHLYQIRTAQKNNKNKLYLHQVLYLDENGNEFNGVFTVKRSNPYYRILFDEIYGDNTYGLLKPKKINYGNTTDYKKDLKKFYKDHKITINCNSSKDFIKKKVRRHEDIFNIWYKHTYTSALYWIPKIWVNNNDKNQVQISTSIFDKIVYNKKDNNQVYKDNDDGTCFYDGVLSFFKNKIEKNEKDKISKSIVNKLTKTNKYKKSYTKEEIKSFCEEFKISITIKDFITNTDTKINFNKFNKYNIEFINTKYNHLDRLFNDSSNVEEVNKSQLDFLKNTENFYIEKFGKLITLNKTYVKEKNEFDIIFNDWKNKYNIDSMSISENSDIYKLLSNYDFNMHRFFNKFNGDETTYKEYDIKSAYYNYSNKELNKFYIGVPSGSFISHSCDKKFTLSTLKEQAENKIIGFYHVKITDYKIVRQWDKLGFIKGTEHVLFSSMILLLGDYIDFEFLNCCIAPSVDVPYNKDFLKYDPEIKTTKGIKYYCKATGLLIKDSSPCHIKIKPLDNDEEFYNTFHNENLEVFYDNDKKIYYADILNLEKRSFKHIGFSIHAYTTTLILNELLNMDLDKVLGVKLDSIVIDKNYEYEINKKLFGIKTAKLNKMFFNEFGDDKEMIITPYKTCDIYDEIKFDKIFTPNEEYITKRLIYFGGIGGSGKTHSILKSNIPNKNICFSSTSWDLIQEKEKENENIIGLSIPKITGYNNGSKCEEIKNNNIKFIVRDEMTLSKSEDEEMIIKKYNYCFIFFLGDVDEDGRAMQCCLNKNNIYKPNSNTQYIKFTKTYRFDDELNERLIKLRNYMRESNDDISILKYKFKKLFSDRYFDANKIIFNDNDVGISSNDDIKKNNRLTNYFIDKGTKPQYYVKTTNLNKNELRGQKVDTQTGNTENKLFKTIHSFQGRELTQNNNIIIYMGALFDYNLLYTAVSRARRVNQIYLFDKI